MLPSARAFAHDKFHSVISPWSRHSRFGIVVRVNLRLRGGALAFTFRSVMFVYALNERCALPKAY